MSVGLGLYGGLPQYFTDNQFQYQDHLSFIRGKHSFRLALSIAQPTGSSFFHDRRAPHNGGRLLTVCTSPTSRAARAARTSNSPSGVDNYR
jgi:hypothetical protein